jgi:hypothetical protein
MFLTEQELRHELNNQFDFNINTKSWTRRNSEQSKNTMNNEQFKEYVKKEIEFTNPVLINDIDSENRMDHVYDLGWYLFNKHYKLIPSEFHLDKTYNTEIITFLKNNGQLIQRRIQENGNDSDFSEIAYMFLYKNMVVGTIYFFSSKEQTYYARGLHIFHSVDTVIEASVFEQFEKQKKETPKIGIIKQSKFGPQVTWKDHETQNKFSLDNYNEDFSEFFDNISKKLEENKTGLYLCYGEAGTGKSSALRHLITQVDRPFVFVPPQMINYLSSPEFVDLVLTSLKGSVLIIEDAEKALMKRESEDGFHNSELVSSLLNLTDGLYADLANTSIIATYNCDRNLIDPALLRRGRMKAEYKFNRLSIEKSQNLIDKLEYKFNVTEPMTLADIFNHEDQYSNDDREERKTKRQVGFGN